MIKFKNVLVIITTILLSNLGFSQSEHFESLKMFSNPTALPNSVGFPTTLPSTSFNLAIQDALPQLSPNNKYASINPRTSISLGIEKMLDENNIANYNRTYTFTVNLGVYSLASTPVLIQNIELTIVHDNKNGNQYPNDLAVYNLAGQFGAQIKILSISCVDHLNGNVNVNLNETNVYLKMAFDTERYYNIASTTISVLESLVDNSGTTEIVSTPVVSGSNSTSGKDELQISWTLCTGQDCKKPVEYEVEWTWLDNYGSGNSVIPKNQIKLTEQDFKLNSTRIQTKDMFYRIPLIFAKGYLVYRVRPVGRFLNDVTKVYYGSWSTGTTDTFTTVQNWTSITIDKAHEFNAINGESSKNWQFQTSYAEDGKKKDVISYFDGSLRNRQTVTKTNTNKQTIVGEVIYDTQGRPAIEVLPAPVQSSQIKYFNDLNKEAVTGKIFNHKVFDWESTTPDPLCAPISVPKMSTGNGASKYYSDNNPLDLTNKFQDYVPDALGYPFSQIEYTPDNTGRIKRKGGVGQEHQIGKNHEMTYLYTTPSQLELNRLFGNNVGHAERYKKNIVIDPNRQVSVSYLDPQGRTIATALAGDKEGNSIVVLHEAAELPVSLQNVLVNNDKYSSGSFGVLEDGIKLSSSIVPIKEGNNLFNYNFVPTIKIVYFTNKKTKGIAENRIE